jgi:1-deoxy-D-xylulose-5-phosphate synthase
MLLDENISPEKLKSFTLDQKRDLAEELRYFLLRVVPETGGHLSSNLGTVELTIALHSVFDTGGADRIVWDTGHQAYSHKILTGRYKNFRSLRGENGISGFPNPTENSNDAFIAGHAGISLSAGLGLARAKYLNCEDGNVVVIAGDGSLTCGEFTEGLNNTSPELTNLIVVLNDNGMSISKSAGALAKYLRRYRTKKKYHLTKNRVRTALSGNALSRVLMRFISSLRRQAHKMFVPDNLFEHYGYRYLGVVDGHDITALTDAFEAAKIINAPTLIHIHTVKGKGYDQAEQNPGEYHGISKRQAKKNVKQSGIIALPGTVGDAPGIADDTWSDLFAREIADLGARDRHICLVTAAMKYATGCHLFAKKFGSRFFDVGIAEEHAITFAAGLAAGGMKPVVAVYSTFLQRAFDQVLHDACLNNLPLTLAIDRAGLVGEDGITHQGVQDLPWLTALPNMAVFAPSDEAQFCVCLRYVLNRTNGVAAVRYPRGKVSRGMLLKSTKLLEMFRHYVGREILIVTFGRLVNELFALVDGDRVGLLALLRVHPLPVQAVSAALKYKRIFFFEEGVPAVSEHFLAALHEQGWQGSYTAQCIHGMVPHADVRRQMQLCGLDADSARELIRRRIAEEAQRAVGKTRAQQDQDLARQRAMEAHRRDLEEIRAQLNINGAPQKPDPPAQAPAIGAAAVDLPQTAAQAIKTAEIAEVAEIAETVGIGTTDLPKEKPAPPLVKLRLSDMAGLSDLFEGTQNAAGAQEPEKPQSAPEHSANSPTANENTAAAEPLAHT